MGEPPADYLHIIPTEVWLACWTLCSTRQLRRVSLVCQVFRSICLPLLLRLQYASLDALPSGFKYSPEHFIELARRMHRIAVRLDRLAEPPRVLLVRSWQFSALGDNRAVWRSNGKDIYARAITAFSNTLGLYQNLRILHIAGLRIDESLRNALASLPILEDLTLARCDTVARDGGLVRLKYLTISGFWIGSRGGVPEPLQIVSADRLHTLKIIHGSSETSPLLTDLTRVGQPTQLVDLSLHFVDDVDLFFRFLKQCPGLESLAITSISRSTKSTFPARIDPDTIPLLRNLTALLEMVRLLTPHRSVCVVTVSEGQSVTSKPAAGLLLASFLDISRASVFLRSLIVIPPMTPDLFTAIISLFPELQNLSITFLEEDRSRFCCRYPVMRTSDRGDPPSLELCDDEAFDNLPVEEISDDEGDGDADPPRVVTLVDHSTPELPGSRNLYNILNGICGGVISLPPEIAVLCLQVDINTSRLSAAQEHQVVALLSRLYAQLREVRLGFRGNSHWEREGTGAVWMRSGEKEYIQVQQ
ncbi:hypothetical protein C8R44DRAFT_748685 [Mycena epipterygia]|nr:hypothetical protein C8R44DRAFT_748685 [Mycena epipterygia]